MQQLDAERGLTDDAFKAYLPGGQQEDDRNLIVEFFVDKKLMGAKSETAGRPIYEDREYVRIKIKGQDKQIVVEEVKPLHKQKYPIAYHLFQQSKPLPMVGTPVDLLPGVGPSVAHHLKGLNLRSIEDVANITDENTLQAMGAGARELVGRARAWMEQSSERALNLQEQVAAKDREIGQLREMIASFNQRLGRVEAERPPTERARKAPKKARAKKSAAKAASPAAPA